MNVKYIGIKMFLKIFPETSIFQWPEMGQSIVSKVVWEDILDVL